MADTKHNLQISTSVKDLASSALKRLGGTGKRAGTSIAAGFIKAQLALGALKLVIRGTINLVRSMTTEFGETADRTAKLARQLGVGTEALSEYGHIAEFAGTNLEAVAKSVRFVQRSMAEAQRGTLTYKDAFESVGITSEKINELMRKDGVEAFEEVGLAIARANTHAEKINASMVLLGRAGTEMIPVFEQGAEAIRRQRKELKLFGVTLTDAQGRMAEDFQDARKRFDDAITGIKKGVAVRLLPVLTKALNFLANWVAQNREKIVDFFLDLADAMVVMGRAATRAIRALVRGLAIIAGEPENVALEAFFQSLIAKMEKARKMLADIRNRGVTGQGDGKDGGVAPGDPFMTFTDGADPMVVTASYFARLRAGMRKELAKMREDLTPERFGQTVIQSATQAWTGFFDAITFGAQNASDAFRAMATSMLRQLAELAQQKLLLELLSQIPGLAGGAAGGGTSAGAAPSARGGTPAPSGGIS